MHAVALENEDITARIKEALESERKKSDPGGQWLKESRWAMDTLSTWARKEASW